MTHFVRGRKATASAAKYGQAQNQCDSQELPLYGSLISDREDYLRITIRRSRVVRPRTSTA